MNLFMYGKSLIAPVFLAYLLSACGDRYTDVEHIQRAKDFQEAGDFASTLIELKSAAQKNPKSLEARLLLGRLKVYIGDGPGAEKEFLAAESLGLERDAFLVDLAQAYHLQGNFKKLINEVVVKNNLASDIAAELHYLRGKAAIALPNLELAAAEFTKAAENKPVSQYSLLSQATASVIVGDLDSAEALLDQAIAAFPHSEEAYALRGDINLTKGDFQTSKKSYIKALELRSGYAPYLLGLGIAHLNLNELNDAKQKFDLVLKIFPAELRVNYYRALIEYQSKDFDAALVFIERARGDAQSVNLATQLLAGAISYQLGRYEQSRQYLQRVTAVIPGYSPARKLLGATELKLGLVDQAAFTLGATKFDQNDDLSLVAAMAGAALKEGDLGLSARFIEVLTELQPNSALIKAQLGLLQSLQGDSSGRSTLESAIALDPQSITAKLALVLDLLNKKETEKALSLLESMKEISQDNPDLYSLEGIAYGLKSDLERAKQAFEAALSIDPGNINASTNLAAIALQEGNSSRALQIYRRVLVKHPENLVIGLKLAALEVNDGNLDQAIIVLQKIVENNPYSERAKVMLSSAFLDDNRPGAAIDLATSGLIQFPESAALSELLGRAYLGSGEYEKAATQLENVVEMLPEKVALHHMLGMAYQNMGEYSNAMAEYQAVLNLEPDNYLSRFQRALVLAKTGNQEGFLMELSLLRKQFPGHPQLNELEGDFSFAKGDFAQAEKFYQLTREKHENNFIVTKLALAQAKNGVTEQSIRTLDQWLERYPEDLLTRNALADLYLTNRNFEKALEHYERSVGVNAGNAAVQNNIAWALVEIGSYAESIKYAKAAYKLKPNSLAVLDTYGFALYKNREYDLAEEILTEALKVAPRNPSIMFKLAKTYIELSRNKEAKGLIEKTLKSDAFFPEKEEALKLLQTLG